MALTAGTADARPHRRQDMIADARIQAGVARAPAAEWPTPTITESSANRAAQTQQATDGAAAVLPPLHRVDATAHSSQEEDSGAIAMAGSRTVSRARKRLKTENPSVVDTNATDQQQRNEALRFLYTNPIARKSCVASTATCSGTSTDPIALLDDQDETSNASIDEAVGFARTMSRSPTATTGNGDPISETEQQLHHHKNPMISSVLKYISVKRQEANDLKLAMKLQEEEEQRVDEEAGMASTHTGKAFKFVERVYELQAELLSEEAGRRSMLRPIDYDSDDDRKPAAVDFKQSNDVDSTSGDWFADLCQIFDYDINSTSAVKGKIEEQSETYLCLSKIQTVAIDDMVFMAEKMLDKQQEFQIRDTVMAEPSKGAANYGEDEAAQLLLPLSYFESKQPIPTSLAVDIGIHFTRSANMDRIKTDGLLTRPERSEAGIREDRYTGSAYGEGIYTGNNYFSYAHYGDVGILCARLHGRVSADRYDPNCDTVIPFRTCGSRDQMVVLKSSSQCIPLVFFPQSLLMENHNQSSDNSIEFSEGCKAVHRYHCKLQKIVNEFFNTGTGTTIPPLPSIEDVATPPRHHIRRNRRIQRVAAPPMPSAQATSHHHTSISAGFPPGPSPSTNFVPLNFAYPGFP
eukprot:CAMPEP_0118686382 /NCGR_PEP_ID=MMETSP0800-20121206/7782_1 /TAXON_ID=210618 ORGANISM="Striatella unipunctata, Strain CCMP2910" /NCGR_SAMPLE_ID=MMETSP0800 /ASSEMBLY_ACC=CAM_ASM_000638 /LENGTH=632 /DNA_ID=CAMNT_0006583421 /DNA_START=81 /DNA_END=1979 /DNA_ORIENTATION=-